MKSSAHYCAELISQITFLLSDTNSGLPWLRSMIHRQRCQPGKILGCGTPPEPLPAHLDRFHREWKSTLHEIAAACPVIADDTRALLSLNPFDPENDSAIDVHLAPIRAALSNPKVALGMERERERDIFADNLRRLRAEKGLSLRGFERECRKAARRLGSSVSAPDRHQLMDYEAGRSNAHPSSKVVLAAALGVAVDQIYG